MDESLFERKTINTLEDTYSTDNLIVFSRRKKSKFKEHLVNSLFSLDKRPYLLSLSKLLFGFILLGLPSFGLFFLIYLIIPTPTRFLILPFIISITLTISMLIMLMITKIGINCRSSGILIASWERQSLLRIFSCMIFNFFLLGCIMHSEQFCIDFPIFQGNIGQMDKKEFESARELVQGSFLFRVLFLNFFWDAKHCSLGYFDLTKNFLKAFRDNMNVITSSILATAIYYLIKVIFISSKNTMMYIGICCIVMYECFLFMYFPIGDEFNYSTSGVFFKYSKVFELVPLIFVLVGLGWIAFKTHILALNKKKLYSYKSRKKDKVTIIIAIASFVIILIGLAIIMYVMIYMLFITIEPSLEFSVFHRLYSTFFSGLLISTIGYYFSYGHYYFSLVYKPIVFEFYQAIQKKPFYIRCSYNLRMKKTINRKSKRVLI